MEGMQFILLDLVYYGGIIIIIIHVRGSRE